MLHRRRFATAFAVLLCALALIGPPLASAQDESPQPGLTIHVVQRGENLFRIGLRYGISVDDLARLNGILDVTNIQVGQRLLVPAAPGTAVEAAPPAESAPVEQAQVPEAPPQESAPAAEPETLTSLPDRVWHIVLPGETLFKIATAYGITVNELSSANSIGDPSLIYVGQQLLIPGIEPPQIAVELPANVVDVRIQPQVFVAGRTGMAVLATRAPANVSGSFVGQTLRGSTDDARMVHVVLFGIPINTGAGVYPLVIDIDDGSGPTSLTINAQVVDGQYYTEGITIPNDRLALLQGDVNDAEASLVSQIMATYTPVRMYDGPMTLPAAAAITSPFGSLRSYNSGVLQSLHTGTDFAGAPGTPIFAAGSGQVVFSGHLDVRGLATIIDHGWGIHTGYWHQTETYVQVGDTVSAGQVIGTVGSSGRVTGPHLHWELWVNGVPVDPMQWVQQTFLP
ncbi:MAG: peptidoglycan DD-metalloendopeptidase family protein [Anaerolineae bacterium]|nr:peptidoglycan DD-metalloendopeptidase family protein [Anaerolineae bacterium]